MSEDFYIGDQAVEECEFCGELLVDCDCLDEFDDYLPEYPEKWADELSIDPFGDGYKD